MLDEIKQYLIRKKVSFLSIYLLSYTPAPSKRIVQVLHILHKKFLQKYKNIYHTSFADMHPHEFRSEFDSMCQHELFFLMGINIIIWKTIKRKEYIIEEIHRVTSKSGILRTFLVFFHSSSWIWRYIKLYLLESKWIHNKYLCK